ncbi:PilX N-terminal domain-containing pilus assembly protein [Polaromonas sp. CT11-55]|uniref:pilus assembly PilX family protein n=1 Tax=Polaromonas sp. CT11-55 TaxID=3243045 RepID=UPI0039A4BF7F
MSEKFCAIDCHVKSAGAPRAGRKRLRVSSVNPARRRQRGMTLLVGMILLVMLMVISVVGFRNTTLSERMTGNVVDRNISFQSAENSGKEALQVIESGSFNASTIGHYSPALASGGTTNFWTQGDGVTVATPATGCPTTTPFSWTSCAVAVTTKYANNANNAQYVIELLTQVSSGGSTTSTYRVTSRSTGGSGNAEVVLQVLYTKTTTP